MKAIRVGPSKQKSKKFKISRFFEIYAISYPIEGRPDVIISRKNVTSVFSQKRFYSVATQNLPQ